MSNKGNRVADFYSLFIRKDVLGNEKKQVQLLSLDHVYNLPFKDYDLFFCKRIVEASRIAPRILVVKVADSSSILCKWESSSSS